MTPHPNELVSGPKINEEELQSIKEIKEEKKQVSGEKVTSEDVVAREYNIVWQSAIMLTTLHFGAVYALMFVVWQCQLMTLMWGVYLWFWTITGVTAGLHRLWAHRSYKAKWPLRLMLAVLTLIAHQNSIYEWSRDHRAHHKFSETDADPHNAKRGFFFSHVGWLMVRKHPDVIKNGQKIDLGDLMSDPIVKYQHKYYMVLMPLMCFVMPSLLPTIWGETLWNGFFIGAILRYVVTLNFTWLVNSAAHMWGNKPYDIHINPVQNMFVSVVTNGEGWHNYHHTFPQDYRAGEFGWRLNTTAIFLDVMAALGLAYDLKTISPAAIQARRKRTGDLSLQKSQDKFH